MCWKPNLAQSPSLIRLPFTLISALTDIKHTHHFLLSQLWYWDLAFNGFWGWKSKRARSPWDISIEDVVCVWCTLPYFSLWLLLVEVFAIAGEPCYQILKMLSSPPRLPTRAGDMYSPPHFYRLSVSSLYFVSFQMSESSSDVLFFCLALLLYFSHILILQIIYYLSPLSLHPPCCVCWCCCFKG